MTEGSRSTKMALMAVVGKGDNVQVLLNLGQFLRVRIRGSIRLDLMLGEIFLIFTCNQV